jgi:hypothetical protein
MIRSEHMKSCLSAQKRFLLFKEPGFFKKKFYIGGNVEDLQAYRLIPRTPLLPGHFTIPLNKRLMCGGCKVNRENGDRQVNFYNRTDGNVVVRAKNIVTIYSQS